MLTEPDKLIPTTKLLLRTGASLASCGRVVADLGGDIGLSGAPAVQARQLRRILAEAAASLGNGPVGRATTTLLALSADSESLPAQARRQRAAKILLGLEDIPTHRSLSETQMGPFYKTLQGELARELAWAIAACSLSDDNQKKRDL